MLVEDNGRWYQHVLSWTVRISHVFRSLIDVTVVDSYVAECWRISKRTLKGYFDVILHRLLRGSVQWGGAASPDGPALSFRGSIANFITDI